MCTKNRRPLEVITRKLVMPEPKLHAFANIFLRNFQPSLTTSFLKGLSFYILTEKKLIDSVICCVLC